jgi:murein tripeptide amidase MpaA
MTSIVARIYFASRDDLNWLAGNLDIWEVNHKDGFLVALLRPDQYADLIQRGHRIEIDEEKTGLHMGPAQSLPGQIDAIPGYPCYRTVEETFSSMKNLESAYPNLVSLLDIGNSWDKLSSGGATGYDLYVMVLGNKSTAGPKPRFFLIAEVHAREYVTAETALRFAEHLLSRYSIDPDITWLLDFSELHILPMANPDGRKQAENGILWRKNTDSNDGCANASYWGTDLNRNYAFKWGCCWGSSEDPCAATYRGPLPASEPEVQAVQNYAGSIFPDQRGPGDDDPAPDDATGLLISLHSYGELVLWPWGWTSTAAPNSGQLQTLGRKLAYFNSYVPQQAYNLYATDGSTDDWAYGQLGIAAYTFEMGTNFFQRCADFENTIYPRNRDALLYGFKAARMPYQNPAGPDSLNVAISSDMILAGTKITLTATADNTRYSIAGGPEPSRNVTSAQYTINNPSWVEGVVACIMTVADGSFDSVIEDVVATVDTTGWAPGRYTIFVESQDEEGNLGVPTAMFVTVVDHLPRQAKVRIKPRRISFGKIPMGTTSVTKNITIINAGKKDMEITSIELLGSHQSDFLFTHDCTGQYLRGDSCSVTVTVHPSGLGKREATLVVSSNDVRKPTKNVLLRANAKPSAPSSGQTLSLLEHFGRPGH